MIERSDSFHATPPLSVVRYVPRYGGGRIGSQLGTVLAPICRTVGMVRAELILDWNVIAGSVYGAETRPIRITGIRPNRCLYVGASRSLAALMTYEVPALLERIHRYFGEAIVDTIKFEDDHYRPQVSAPRRPGPQPVPSELSATIQEAVSYSPLAEALERLASWLD